MPMLQKETYSSDLEIPWKFVSRFQQSIARSMPLIGRQT
jgi:hypothetical protein